jgi:hypothetical protein
MIVANMNLHEVYANLVQEMPKLEWKRDTLFRKASKAFRKNGTFPAWQMYEYKLPSSNNQYIIYFYKEHPFANVLGGFLFTMFDNNKRFVIKWTNSDIPDILVLTSHFLQRYKERFLKEPHLTANETAVRYFSRNWALRPMPVDERINKHIEKYGEFAGEGFLVNDGFCFKLSGEEALEGEKPVRISFFTTFMPLSDMSESQREAIFEECMKDIDDL